MISNSILLVDDDQELLKVYRKIFELKGFSVKTADNGIAAIEIMEKHEIAVVVLDIIMPKMSGMQALTQMKKRWPMTEVIMLTAEGTIPGAVEAVKKGAYTYFIKPVDIDELIVTVVKAQELANVRMENSRLKQHLFSISATNKLIGESDAARKMREEAVTIGRTMASVLITGESGTGKEVMAHLIHRCSERADKPFVSVNCAAFNENLIESELFGYEKGAYTGADKRRKGRFELADGGTIFFDEIGELSLNMQTKLLRVLQEKTFERVGGSETIQSDFRLISATNADLKHEIEAGRFRLDLFYRLNILPIEIPPLRERRQDIPLLVNYFMESISKEMGRKIESVEVNVMQMLKNYSWPGNIRELRNIVERLVVMAQDGKINSDNLPPEIREAESDTNKIYSDDLRGATHDFEKEYIMETMRRNSWNVTKAAREMNIARKTLYKKLNDYGIKYR
ncbi:MAG: sigma-54 dependent transcriptional regulator [Eubacterium sp.]|nr:sigma-54 dependent transcriptional regulator [Eubacterium sp.]